MFLYICRMEDPAAELRAWQDRFFGNLANPGALLDLFDYLPGVYMYVKDIQGQFVRANRVVCEVVGVASPSEVIGKTDFDFFPPAIAAQYVEEDQRVIASGKTLTDQVWLVPGPSGLPHWYLCNKIPLYDREQIVVGIAGIKRPYESGGGNATGYGRLLSVVEYVSERYGEDIEVADLAAHISLSVSQLQREFSRLFGITPVRYIREVRIGVARHQMATSDDSLATIANHCGFYDQSHFTRQFKNSTGMTPMEYRKRFQV